MVQNSTLEPIHQMLAYKKWQTASHEYNLKNVKFILTGQQITETIQQNALKLHVSSDNEKLKSIFGELLKHNIEK